MPDEILYEVTIKKITKGQKQRSEWVKLRDPYPDERSYRGGDEEKDPQYGYRPVMAEVETSQEIYSQRGSPLDLTAVIKAVNGL